VIARSGRQVLVLAALTAMAGVAAGQETVGREFRVNSFPTGSQERPAASADAGGSFVVVWESFGQDGSGAAVVAQRFQRSGAPLGAELVANTFTTSAQARPAVAVAASGAFVVAWQSLGQDGFDYGVFARRFDAAGAPLDGSEFLVNSFTTFAQSRPDVASTPAGDFVVVWQGAVVDGSNFGIFGRRFSAAGVPLGAEFRINEHTTNAQTEPVVAASPDGGFVVAWQSDLQDGSEYGVFARRFDSAGTPAGPEFRVNTSTAYSQRDPDIAMDGSGAFVVVWTSPHLDGSMRVLGQRFDAAANAVGSQFNVTIGGAQDPPRYPSVGRDPSGGFVVAWSREDRDGDSYGVVARRFDPAGGLVGDELVVNTFTTGAQVLPAVAPLGAGLFALAWDSSDQDGSQHGIFGQRIGDLVHRDGFETGDTSRWSATSADGGDLAVNVGAAMKLTTFGLQAFVDDTNGLYVQDDTPTNETTYRARFYFHPGDFDPGTTQAHFRTRIFIAFEEGPVRRLLALVLRRLNGQYSLMGRARLDDDAQANTGFFPIATSPHFVECRWVRASTPTAGNGVFELWIDGTPLASLTTLDNNRSAVDFVRMGALSVKAGASGTLYFDEFESRRERAIGP
jgi:hypothetical protein